MQTILKLILTAVAVMILAYILKGVEVASFWAALIVAVVLGLLRLIVKPILVFLTFPITIVTFGLFLLVINAAIIMLADYFIDGFAVRNFWWALGFSILLSFLQSILYSMVEKDAK
ncbi:MAG: phage holin family protein [Flavobacteriaceae bacterium]